MRNSLKIDTDKQTIENDIFEVSINSKKLMSILKKLQDNYSKLLTKIQNIDDFYKEGDSALNRKILNLESNNKTQIQNYVEHIKNAIQADLRKSQEIYIKELHEKESRLNELKYSIQTLNDKINKVNSSLTEQIQNSVRNFSMENFALKRNIEKTQQGIESAFEQVSEKLQSYKSEIKNNKDNIFDLQVKLKKYTEIALRPEDCDRIAMPEKKFEESINAEKYSQFLEKQKEKENSPTHKSGLNNRTTSKEKERSRSRRPIKKSFFATNSPSKRSRLFRPDSFELKQPTQNYMSTLQYASISAKVQNLQKTIKQTFQKNGSQQNPLFIKRSTKTSTMKTFSYSKEEFEKIMQIKDNEDEKSRYDDMDASEIIQRIFYKLELIEKSVEAKQGKLSKSIEQIKEKSIIASQKMEFMKQRINKINSEIAQIKIKFLTVEKKTGQSFDSNSISNIETQVGKIIQRLDKQFQTKLEIEEYEKEKIKMNQKIAVIRQNLVDKAEKIDVKKAINFLQEKIKEIILLIANEYNRDKMGAISKQPAKCLTCDKDILRLENIKNSNGFKGLTVSKSSRDLTQKYFTRLVKSKKQNRPSSKMRHNYTTVTQLTEIQD